MFGKDEIVGLAKKVLYKNDIESYILYLFELYNHYDYKQIEVKIPKDGLLKYLKDNKILLVNLDNRPNCPCIRLLPTNRNTVERVLKVVRRHMENVYGTGTDLAGHCIEASELIVLLLKKLRFNNVKSVEGWCCYDDEYYGSDRPYDEHTWVELDDYYLDVTADQFNPGMCRENEFPSIIINKGLPYGMCYEEPSYDDYDEDEEN